ncbi:platelet-activating factor acetylhydrolase 2, cytoplasmic-like [Oppia nitens]|uniref:platelet-activating factor acetylhydrolase 2, cytoplasmic-like n=1 Tax=Oppia nitens TaxID=1686743 RepID=UPI0023DC84D0|nr:platelet-activating factor acetylhydrolase 2, cytoplasmic-like [Oppia nitens]
MKLRKSFKRSAAAATTAADKCRDRSLQTGRRYHLPLPTGPYPNLGYLDVLTGSGKQDGLLVRIIYPAADQTTPTTDQWRQWPNWSPHDNYKTGYLRAAQLPGPVARLVNHWSTDVFVPIVDSWEPLRESPFGQSFPVIIFSHGLLSCRTTYSSVCTEMASHGFIVFAVEHRDQTAVASFYPSAGNTTNNKDNNNTETAASADGQSAAYEWVDYLPVKLYDNDLPVRNRQLDERVDDIRRTIRLIGDINNGNRVDNVFGRSPTPATDAVEDSNLQALAGLLDTNNLILMGHSFGSSTTIRSLATDDLRDSIRLGVCLDAWMYPLQQPWTPSPGACSKPLIFINMERFQVQGQNLKMMKQYIGEDGQNTDDRRVHTVRQAKHTDQSDIPFVLNSGLLWLTGMRPMVDPFVTLDLTTGLALEFIADKLDIKLVNSKQYIIDRHRDLLMDGIDGKWWRQQQQQQQ